MRKNLNDLEQQLTQFKNTLVLSARNFRNLSVTDLSELVVRALAVLITLPSAYRSLSIYRNKSTFGGNEFGMLINVLFFIVGLGFSYAMLKRSRTQMANKPVDDASFNALQGIVNQNRSFFSFFDISSPVLQFLNSSTRGSFSAMQSAIDAEIQTLQSELKSFSRYIGGTRFKNITSVDLSFSAERPSLFKNVIEERNSHVKEASEIIEYTLS